jgi:hypothetical protein
MSRRRRPWVRDKRVALACGLALYVAGSLLIYDAYERRGRERPFGMRLAGGLV